MPEEQVVFRSKPQIALSLVDLSLEWGVPFGVVVADSGYGKYPMFLEGLEERRLPYVCGVESTFGVRLPEEVVVAAKEGGRSSALWGEGTTSQGAPSSTVRGQGPDRLPPARSMADGRLEGGDQGNFKQANDSAASAPGDGKRSSQHRP